MFLFCNLKEFANGDKVKEGWDREGLLNENPGGYCAGKGVDTPKEDGNVRVPVYAGHGFGGGEGSPPYQPPKQNEAESFKLENVKEFANGAKVKEGSDCEGLLNENPKPKEDTVGGKGVNTPKESGEDTVEGEDNNVRVHMTNGHDGLDKTEDGEKKSVPPKFGGLEDTAVDGDKLVAGLGLEDSEGGVNMNMSKGVLKMDKVVSGRVLGGEFERMLVMDAMKGAISIENLFRSVLRGGEVCNHNVLRHLFCVVTN